MMHHASFLRQKGVMEEALTQLESSPGQLIAKLHRLRELIVAPRLVTPLNSANPILESAQIVQIVRGGGLG